MDAFQPFFTLPTAELSRIIGQPETVSRDFAQRVDIGYASFRREVCGPLNRVDERAEIWIGLSCALGPILGERSRPAVTDEVKKQIARFGRGNLGVGRPQAPTHSFVVVLKFNTEVRASELYAIPDVSRFKDPPLPEADLGFVIVARFAYAFFWAL